VRKLTPTTPKWEERVRRLLYILIFHPFMLFVILFKNLIFIVEKIKGKKLIVYNMHHDYFFNTFESIYHKLETISEVKVYFSYDFGNNALKEHLSNFVPKKRIIDNRISPFLVFNLFITAEITGPDMPFNGLKTKKLQMYHGIGNYNLWEKEALLKRFNIHFAVGPQYHAFFDAVTINSANGYQVYSVGYAKTDAIVNDSYDNNAICEYYDIPNTKPVVLFAPHWGTASCIHKCFEELMEKISSLDVTLLIKLHNFIFIKFPEANWHKKIKRICDNHSNVKFIEEPDTQKFYNIADILVTDSHTTALIEYSLTGKPIIMFKDETWFTGFNNGIQPETDMSKTGIEVKNPTECVTLIKKIIDNSHEIKALLSTQHTKEKELVNKYFFNIGNASHASVEAIMKELEIGK